MKKGLPLYYFKSLFNFVVFLLNKADEDFSQKELENELKRYFVKGICDCVSDEKEVCFPLCCGSFYLEVDDSKKGLFEPDDILLIFSNIGIFIFHIDEMGNLIECEFMYKLDFYPEFYLRVLKNFKDEKGYKVYLNYFKNNEVKFCSLRKLKQVFRLQKGNVIEVD